MPHHNTKIASQIITVQLPLDAQDRSYPIVIGHRLLQNSEFLKQYIPHQQICFISNTTVAPLYLPLLQSALIEHGSIKKISSVILPDGEQYKTLNHLEIIFDHLMEQQFDRSTLLCAIGGGVIGDMTGFAAACYRRGVDFIQIPTTLLAQVDAAIGGKTAVNHPLGKNMIGAFYQPKAVIIDIDTLQTLPEREYLAGLAEVIKYSLIQDKNLFNQLIVDADAILQRDKKALWNIIHRCCAIKADIVSKDERESGLRAILNFGHTFGHALEAATHYAVWLHGETIAIGIVAASFMSLQLQYIQQKDFDTILHLLQKFKLPCYQSHLQDPMQLKSFMVQDKKIVNQTLKLILLESIGKAFITTEFSTALLEEALAFITVVP